MSTETKSSMNVNDKNDKYVLIFDEKEIGETGDFVRADHICSFNTSSDLQSKIQYRL